MQIVFQTNFYYFLISKQGWNFVRIICLMRGSLSVIEFGKKFFFFLTTFMTQTLQIKIQRSSSS